MDNLWEKAKSVSVRTGSEIVGGFDVGFDGKIAEETKDALMRFLYWVEDHYSLPITLWVDFKYKHYLIDDDKKRAYYRFYWVEYESLAAFDRFDDIPVIELAARCEHRALDAVLSTLIEGISHYFAWLSGMNMKAFRPDKMLTEEILSRYKNSRGE